VEFLYRYQFTLHAAHQQASYINQLTQLIISRCQSLCEMSYNGRLSNDTPISTFSSTTQDVGAQNAHMRTTAHEQLLLKVLVSQYSVVKMSLRYILQELKLCEIQHPCIRWFLTHDGDLVTKCSDQRKCQCWSSSGSWDRIITKCHWRSCWSMEKAVTCMHEGEHLLK